MKAYEPVYLTSRDFWKGDPSSFSEMADAVYNQMLYVDNVNSRFAAWDKVYTDYVQKMKDLTGVDLDNPMRMKKEAMGLPMQEQARRRLERFADFEEQRLQLVLTNPALKDHPDMASPMKPMVDEFVQGIEKHTQEVMSESPGFWPGMRAGLYGGFSGMLHDPVNVASLLVPMGQGKTIWQGALRAAAVNAGMEAGMQPFVQDWRREAGLKYGAGHALKNIALAGLLGGGMEAGLGVAGKMTGLSSRPFFRSPRHEDEALHKAVNDLPEDHPVRQAYEADPADRRAALEELGLNDPSLRAQLHEAETSLVFETLKEPGDIDGDHVAATIASLRHALRPDEHPAPQVMPGKIREAQERALHDMAEDMPSTGTFEWHGKQVHKQVFDPEKLVFDAKEFQFKTGGDGDGVTERLRDVQSWSPLAAGRVFVFERADGTRVIADGHQRLGLARRLLGSGKEEKIDLEGILFREKDGWTASEVRARAAQKNLQEGSGSVIDAARVLRDRPDLLDNSMPLGSEKMRQARNLMHLSDEAFGMVINEVVPVNYAALVGRSFADPSRHVDVMRELAELKPKNIHEAEQMVADIQTMPSVTSVTGDLFGEQEFTRSLIRERAQVFAQARKIIRTDKKVFATLRREAERIEGSGNVLNKSANETMEEQAAHLTELLSRLASSKGAVSDALNRAAARLVEGIPAKKAADIFVEEMQDMLKKGGVEALMAETPSPSLVRSAASGTSREPSDLQTSIEGTLQRKLQSEKGKVKGMLDNLVGNESDSRVAITPATEAEMVAADRIASLADDLEKC